MPLLTSESALTRFTDGYAKTRFPPYSRLDQAAEDLFHAISCALDGDKCEPGLFVFGSDFDTTLAAKFHHALENTVATGRRYRGKTLLRLPASLRLCDGCPCSMRGTRVPRTRRARPMHCSFSATIQSPRNYQRTGIRRNLAETSARDSQAGHAPLSGVPEDRENRTGN